MPRMFCLMLHQTFSCLTIAVQKWQFYTVIFTVFACQPIWHGVKWTTNAVSLSWLLYLECQCCHSLSPGSLWSLRFVQERGFRTNYCLFLQHPLLQFLYISTHGRKKPKTTIFRLQLLESKILCLTANEGWWFERSNTPLRRFFFCRPLTLKIKWAGLFAHCKQGHNGGSLWGLH